MRRFVVVLLASFAIVGTALVGFSFAGVVGSSSTRTANDVTTINVSAYEYNFTLSASTAPAGTINFVVTNIGKDDHDFSMAGKKTPTIPPGQTATLTLNLAAGSYNYACTIGEHASFGMQGNFIVTGSTQTTTAVTTITTGGTTQVVTTTGASTTTPPPTPASTVNVSEKEFKIILPSTTKKVAAYKTVKGKRVKYFRSVTTPKPVKAGLVHFVIKNVGKIPHNFVIGGQQSLVISSGKSTTLDVNLKKGTYKYECSITGHAALGMKGTLVVT